MFLIVLCFFLLVDAHKIQPLLRDESWFYNNPSLYGTPIWYSTKANAKRQENSAIFASPSEIDSNGTDVVVSWTNIDYDYGDYVAVWCPPQYIPNGEASLGTALDIQLVIPETSNMTFKFLINLRCDYQFMYLKTDGQSWNPQAVHTVIAISNAVKVKGGILQPIQGHLALTKNIDEMYVSWVTGGNKSEVGKSKVKIGISPENLTMLFENDDIITYNINDLCGYPANINIQPFYRDPGLIHHVLLRGLKPNTEYFYQFGNEITGWSSIRRFHSRNDSENSTKFIFYGDMGSDLFPRAVGTVQRAMEEKDLSFILHAGDLSYAMGFSWMWDYFFDVIEPIATSVPYMVSIGNHEFDEVSGSHPSWHPSWGNYGDDSGGECAVPVKKRFRMPNPEKFWYSFRYHNVHIVMMSTEHDFTDGSEQIDWLIKDLSSVDRRKTPFVVLTGHRPMYTSIPDAGEQSVAAHLRLYLEPILQKYHVQVCLWGHIHLYERSCPVLNGTCITNGKAPVHLTVGTAGTDLETEVQLNNTWSVQTIVDWGYVILETSEMELRLQFRRNVDGKILDETIVNLW